MKNKLFKGFDLKNDKQKISVLVLVCLVLVFAYIVTGFFDGKKSKDTMQQVATGEKKEIDSENKGAENSKDKNELLAKYEEKQKSNLKDILKQINGVGQVDVMITFESDEAKVPAVDTNKQTSTTKEKDEGGGERVTNESNDGNKVVITSNNNGNEPLILKTYKPKVIGVVIVAQGAENSKTKYDISKAVANLYALSMDKVNVYPMKK